MLQTVQGGACATLRPGDAPPAGEDRPVSAAVTPRPGHPAPEAPAAEDAPPEVRTYAELNHDLAQALYGAGGGCARVASALDAWTAAHGEAMRRAVVAIDAWEARVGRRAARPHHAAMARDIDARVEAGMRCDAHPGARAAFERFFTAVGFDR